MKYVWAVIRREYLERVRSKGFILATIAGPVLMIGMLALSITMGMKSQRAERSIAVIDQTGELAAIVIPKLEEAGYSVEDSREDPVDLDLRVEEGELNAYLIFDELTLSDGVVTYRAEESPGGLRSGLIRAMVVQGVLQVRFGGESGTEVSALLAGGELEFEVVGAPSGDERGRKASLVAGMVGAMILYISLLLYGTMVLRSVLEEKRSRVVEVVISSIRPWQLMLGKILGVGAVGLTQLGVWIGFGVLMTSTALPMLAASIPVMEETAELAEYLPGFGTVVLFMAFFLLGFFLYSSLFAAAGAMCTKEEDAQQVVMPLMLLLIVPFVLQVSSVNGTGLAWLDWAALFPFFSPVLMFPRAVSGAVPTWMVAASLVLMAITVVLTSWVAGRIYRVGILMQGKRPTVPELWRWIKEA